MSAKRKNKQPFRPFEGTREEDRHYRFTRSMIDSKAFQSLELTQVALYFEFKILYHPDYSHKGKLIPSNENNIVFPHSRWKLLYKNNYRRWKKDLQALIDKGFIKIIERGKTTRTPNIYAFSSDWQKYE